LICVAVPVFHLEKKHEESKEIPGVKKFET